MVVYPLCVCVLIVYLVYLVLVIRQINIYSLRTIDVEMSWSWSQLLCQHRTWYGKNCGWWGPTISGYLPENENGVWFCCFGWLWGKIYPKESNLICDRKSRGIDFSNTFYGSLGVNATVCLYELCCRGSPLRIVTVLFIAFMIWLDFLDHDMVEIEYDMGDIEPAGNRRSLNHWVQSCCVKLFMSAIMILFFRRQYLNLFFHPQYLNVCPDGDHGPESDRVKKEAEENAKKLAADKARKVAAAEKDKKLAEEKAKKEAEEKAKNLASDKARKEADDRAEKDKKIAEEKAKKEAEEKAKKEAEERAKKLAADKARMEAAAEKDKKIAEEKAKKEGEEKAKKLVADKVRKEAEDRAAAEQGKKLAEERAKKEAEENAKNSASDRARKEADDKAATKKDMEKAGYTSAVKAKEDRKDKTSAAKTKQAEDVSLSIDFSRLELGSLIEIGGFSKVFEAQYMGESVAVKRADSSSKNILLREAKLCSKLRHGHVISLRGVCMDASAVDARGSALGVCLVMQLATHSSILKAMDKPSIRAQFGSLHRRFTFLAEAASGFYYLHSQFLPILHRDIKPGNVLVTALLQPLIADFGLACELGEDTDLGEGTQNYMAPELFHGVDPSCGSDVYAFSLLMQFFAIRSEGGGSEPWAGKTNVQIQELVEKGFRPEWPNVLKEDSSQARFLQLTSRCWDQDPNLRPCFGEISETLRVMAHEFPAPDIITVQASTSQAIAKDLRCQLCKALVDELEREKLFVRNPGGVKHCTLDLRQQLSSAQSWLHAVAMEHVWRSSPANSTIEDRHALVGITAVVSASATARFAAHMVAVSERGHPDLGWAGGGVFSRTWDRLAFDRFGPHDRVEQNEMDVEWRLQVLKRLEAQPALVTRHPLCPSVRVHTVYHACRDTATALSICRTGFVALASLDPGFYSQGLYFTLDLDYALQYGLDMLDSDGRVTILVCDAVVGNVYPVIEHPDDPIHSLKGRPQVPRYDTHCVFVEDGPCTPCPPERWDAVTTYSELVFFENAAVLPRFVLFFTLR